MMMMHMAATAAAAIFFKSCCCCFLLLLFLQEEFKGFINIASKIFTFFFFSSAATVKPLQTGSELMLLPAPKVVVTLEESEECGTGYLNLKPAPSSVSAAYIAKLKSDRRQGLMLLVTAPKPKPSLVVTEEEKESGMGILMCFRYSIHPSWEVTEQEESDTKPSSSSSVTSKSAYATPPIPTTEAANAASLQHHDSNTSTTDSSLLSGSSQTQKHIENPTKAVKRSTSIASVPKRPKQDTVKTETKPKRDPAAKLKSDRSEDINLVATARKPSWVVTASSRTQKRIDDSRNPTKGVKRSGRTVFVTKQLKQSLVKTETKPKNVLVAKLKCHKREDVKLLSTTRKPSAVVTRSSQAQKHINDPKNAIKGVKRSGPIASVTKQPKQSLVKTENNPKNDFVVKLKAPASRWKF